jgi:glucokinase
LALACGLDLGGTKLLGVVVDTDRPGPPLVEERVPTPRGADAVVESIVEVAGLLRSKAGGEVVAVGLGAPGLVDRTGTLRMGPNLPGVVDLGLGELLHDRLDLPVVVDNDATAAAWGEHEWGAARGHDHSMTVSLGTGIGAGFTVKGEVLRGANGFAGEPGHMIVDPTGPRCPCGQRGCWERYASGSGLGRLAREAAHAGLAPSLVERAGGEPEDVRGEHVTDAGREGDPAALDVLRTFAWWVALGLANLVNILDSDVIVIAGGLAEAGDLVIDPTRAAYRDLVLGHDRRPEVPIHTAELGERAAAIGAALLAVARRP